jgi:hypothetical protein
VANYSGKTYKDASLKFIAGDVRREKPQGTSAGPFGAAPSKDEETMGMAEKAFFEYHMYTLDRPSTVADNEVKQLEMFKPARGVKVEKLFLYTPHPGWRWTERGNVEPTYGSTNINKKVQVFVELANTEANKLGIPLPAGKVRCYKQDPADKALEFIGEEQIDHTPKDEELSLQIGNAFDIVGERKQTVFRVESRRNWMTESFEIKIRNHKTEDVVVRVKEPLYRWNTGKVVENNQQEYFKKLDAFNVAWDLPVKADGETVLTYTVEYTW